MGACRISVSPGLLRRFAQDKRGASAIFTSVVFAVLMWCAALAVDVGALYFERRHAQGAVDIAAMKAAQDIPEGRERAMVALRDNGIEDIGKLVVTPGHYRASADIEPGSRFVANAEPYNAVQVTLLKSSPLYFGAAMLGVERWNIQTEAIAVNTKQATFSIGSRLLAVRDGVLNAVLEGLLGGKVALSVMDYNALIAAEVDLFSFLDALASELDLEAASYNEVLNSNASAGQVLDAMAVVTASSGQQSAALVLKDIAAGTDASDKSVPLNSLLDLGPYGELTANSQAPGFTPKLNAMQILSAAGAIANGENQVSINLGAAVPGLSNITLDIAVGEPPQGGSWITVGAEGAVVRTAQTRLRLVAQVGTDKLPGAVSLRVPLYAEIAYAEGRIDSLTCGADVTRDGEVRVAARPGIADLWLGEVDPRALDDFSGSLPVKAAKLIETSLLRIEAESHAAVTNTSETLLSFDWDDIEAQEVKSTSTRDILTTLLMSLLRHTDIEVQAGGVGLHLPGPLKSLVRSVLVTAAPALDTVLSNILDTLGIVLGEADVRVHGLRCDGSALVG